MAFRLPAITFNRLSSITDRSRPQFIQPTRLSLSQRTMASATLRKYEWLIVVPDFPDAQEKRLEVRPTHFAGLKPHLESGSLKMGGAILSEVPPDDEVTSLKFAGSTLIAIAESKEEIVTMLKNDVYAKEGVWDVEKAQMWPVKLAFRHTL